MFRAPLNWVDLSNLTILAFLPSVKRVPRKHHNIPLPLPHEACRTSSSKKCTRSHYFLSHSRSKESITSSTAAKWRSTGQEDRDSRPPHFCRWCQKMLGFSNLWGIRKLLMHIDTCSFLAVCHTSKWLALTSPGYLRPQLTAEIRSWTSRIMRLSQSG